MAQRPSNLTGQRFGELTALRPSGNRNHNKTIMWICHCEACGSECEVPSTKLKNNEVRSCGCMEHVRSFRTAKGESGLNVLVTRYKQGAASRNLVFTLTKWDVKQLSSSPCTYCGILPSNVIYGSLGAAKEHGKYVYNGIDRVDNSIGYIIENCVPCCTACNLAKHTRSSIEFLSWIERVYKYIHSNS